MLLAEFAILFDLDSVGVVLFVFESIVISLFAFRTYERYFASCSFRCHNFTYNFLKKLHPFFPECLLILSNAITVVKFFYRFFTFFYFFYYIFFIYIYKLKILRFVFPFTTRFFTRFIGKKTINYSDYNFFNFNGTFAKTLPERLYYILNFKSKILIFI